MAIVAAVVIVPLGLLFLLSGLVVNLIQAIVFVTLRLFSKTMYRRINRVVVELLWLELVWLIDWWAGVKVKNTRLSYAIIEVTSIGLLDGSGCLGSTLAVMKNSSKFLPVIGWSMWFSDYVFLERSWAKDESTLKSGFQQLKDFPRPLWLALFVEGTRFTPAKLLAAQEYAASARLPIPRNVLVPRIKGFVSAVSNMRSFVPAIYDVTVAIPKNESSPTMLRLLKGQSSVVHVHMKRYKMKELPETDDGVAQWCRDIFVVKDALLEKHLAEDTFGDKDFKPIDRPKKSLLVVISWSCFLRFGAFEFFEWSELLSTWKGLAFSITGLLVVMIVMYIFILFSQSESSASAKAAAIRSKSGGAPSDPNLNKQH